MKTIKEKDEQKRYWCRIFLILCLLAVIPAFILGLSDVPHSAGVIFSLGGVAIVFWALAVAVWGNISETGIAGEMALFLYWIFSHGFWEKPEYVDVVLKGGAVLFFFITLIGWLMCIKDKYKGVNVLIAMGVTVFIFLAT